jgi:hypothetical protein
VLVPDVPIWMVPATETVEVVWNTALEPVQMAEVKVRGREVALETMNRPDHAPKELRVRAEVRVRMDVPPDTGPSVFHRQKQKITTEQRLK